MYWPLVGVPAGTDPPVIWYVPSPMYVSASTRWYFLFVTDSFVPL